LGRRTLFIVEKILQENIHLSHVVKNIGRDKLKELMEVQGCRSLR
jgi:hypothetical protein